ncbi:MAG: MBL fold metallo-hydrolase [Candidatus Omnitrophota bacterium]
MDKLELKTFITGELHDNCYLIIDQESKQCFMVDCPAPTDEIDKFIQAQGLQVLFIALTHAHFDHISGLGKSSSPFYVHPEDVCLLTDPRLNGSVFFSSFVVIKKEPYLYDQEKPLEFKGHIINVIHTPGHTPGSVSLKLDNWLFSGDTIFFDSVGRTDIPLASHDVLIKGIKEKILTLAPQTVIYPGHGSATTVEREKKHNPFLI